MTATGDAPSAAPPSFDDVYRDHFAYVWQSLRRLGTPTSQLADTAHDVFVEAHRALSRLDATIDLRVWLFALAHRIESARAKRDGGAKSGAPSEAFDPPAKPDADPQCVADDAARARLVSALQSVDIDRRAVLILHDIDGFALEDIARALAISEKVADSRLRIGREELAAAFATLPTPAP